MTGECDFTVRKLSPSGSERENEIEEIKKLCSDRSYMGKDIAEVFSYRDLWANLVIDPYIELAPELVWVAQDRHKGELLGYLTGAVAPDFYRLQEQFVTHYIDKLRTEGLLNLFSNPMQFWGNAASVLSGLDHRTITFLKYLKTKAKQEIPRRPSTPHFNVFARYDGKGIARMLIASYLWELKKLKVPRFHITALYVPGERMRHELEKQRFRVRSLEFFRGDYSIYDTIQTSIFEPYPIMIGCFERAVPYAPLTGAAGCRNAA